jgi:hypothetical protein
MTEEVILERPPDCVSECSYKGHQFGPGGDGEVITSGREYSTKDSFDGSTLTGVEWDVLSMDDMPKRGTKAKRIKVTFVETAFEGDVDLDEEQEGDSYLCRCCQHDLKTVEKPAAKAPRRE